MRGLADKIRGKKEESEISPGMLYATGLVAGGTLDGRVQRDPQGDPGDGADGTARMCCTGARRSVRGCGSLGDGSLGLVALDRLRASWASSW